MGETPYLLIDGAKMQQNIEKMAAIAGGSGVALRPHVKTHKIPAIARAQVEAGATGITVAKVSEGVRPREGQVGEAASIRDYVKQEDR